MLTIREAAPEDAVALMELYLGHLTKSPPEEPQDPGAWAARLAELTADPGYHLLVGAVNGAVVSSVTVVVIQNLTHNLRPYALIENVVTHAGHRGQGHATALMAAACNIAAAAGCYKVMLLTGSKKAGTLDFYQRCGFNREDKTGFIRWL